MQTLRKSAARYASGLLASTRGYTTALPSRESALVDAESADVHVDSVAVPGSDLVKQVVTASFIFNSQCEHHMLPFYGRVMLAYIPAPGGASQLLSRSALDQVVRAYTQRLQVQERITHQLADAVAELALPEGVMVGGKRTLSSRRSPSISRDGM